ncbi:MAG: cupin domain-containing protein [Thermoleophilaceae bacterium]|nr:cupin domain-containing protein [Thermoleophilaceae bacterium]
MRQVSISDPTFTYDPADAEGFRSGMFRFGPELGAQQSGATVYELPPGQSVCPYHYEYGEEEWVVVLAGRATVRTPEGSELLAPFDVSFFPMGPTGAHQILNESDEPIRVLMWSTVVTPTATAYPDSGKVAVWTGDKAEDLIVRRSSAVDYYDGEGG